MPKSKPLKVTAFVTVQCVSCYTIRDICEGEIEPGEQPFCEKCYSPMVLDLWPPKQSGGTRGRR